MRAALLTTLATLTALLGCSSPPATPETPPAPQIVSFTSTSSTVEKGEKVTLSWETKNAATIELRQVDKGVIAGAVDLNGSVEVTVDADALFILVASNARGVHDTASVWVGVANGPSQVLFVASPSKIRAGESAVLAWNAPGAHTVSLASETGTNILVGAQLETGSVEVRPEVDTIYVLTVDGKPFETPVHVAPAIELFQSSPSSATQGSPINIAWKTSGAQKVTLSLVGTGELMSETNQGKVTEGSFAFPVPSGMDPALVLSFELTAESASSTSVATLPIYMAGNPRVTEWKVPRYALEGDTFTVSWKTAETDRVEIVRDGVLIYATPDLDSAEQGSLQFNTPTADTTLLLRAINLRGGEVVADEMTVNPVGLTDPASSTFTATPQPGIANGGDMVMLNWNIPNARNVKIVAKNQWAIHSVSGTTAPTGSIEVYPNKDTEYVLTADNGLTSSIPPMSATVTVTTPAKLVFSRNAAPAGAIINVTGTTLPNTGDMFPMNFAVKNHPSQAFVDIAATGTPIAAPIGTDSTGLLVHLPHPFEANMGGVNLSSDSLSVSVNGWMVFSPTPVSGDSVPALPATFSPYGVDLKTDANSHLYWQLDGTGAQQRLIVQWTDVPFYSPSSARVTVQAQLYGTGEVVYAYGTMVSIPAGRTITVGVQPGDSGTWFPVGNDLLIGGQPQAGDRFSFYSRLTPPFPVVASATPLRIRANLGNGFIVLEGGPTILPAGQFAITEVNFNPATGLGQWFEVLNLTSQAVDMAGWDIDFGGGVVHTLSSTTGTTLLPANGRLLFGQTSNAAEGAATVDYVYGNGFTLPATGGSLVIGMGGLKYTNIDWTAGAAQGASFQKEPVQTDLAYASGIAPLACAARLPYGTHGQKGTPGAVNGRCFDYVKSNITGAFQSILSTGTVVGTLTGATNTDNKVEKLTLGRPVKLWGQSVTDLYVCSNGYLAATQVISSDSNKTAPSPTSTPVGAIAPMWDDLIGNSSSSSVLWQQFDPDSTPNTGDEYTLVSWENWKAYSGTSSLNFQVKFYEGSGNLEFHYGTMTSSSTSYMNGANATVWLEHPTGGEALIVGANVANSISTSTGYRFTVQ